MINQGYKIIKIIKLSDKEGLAIAHNEKSNMFVCWFYKVENGEYIYYWGIYSDMKIHVIHSMRERYTRELKYKKAC